MQIILNKKAIDFTGSTISQLCDFLALSPFGVAIAVNGQIIANNLWPDFVINENDTVSVITATRGG